jgi:hypothetical protein
MTNTAEAAVLVFLVAANQINLEKLPFGEFFFFV